MSTLRRFFNSSSAKAAVSQNALVDHLVERGAVSNPRAVAVLRQVDRKLFIRPSEGIRSLMAEQDAYRDAPLPIGLGQTISAPHMHAVALQLLSDWLTPGARVLDVGSGSGYLTACMARMVQPGGFVLGVDKVPELVTHAHAAMKLACPDLPPGSWRIEHGNVLAGGLAEREAGFNAIHVGAAAAQLPQELLDCMLPGSRMIIPVGEQGGTQTLVAVDKDAQGMVVVQQVMGVKYVPLTRPERGHVSGT